MVAGCQAEGFMKRNLDRKKNPAILSLAGVRNVKSYHARRLEDLLSPYKSKADFY